MRITHAAFVSLGAALVLTLPRPVAAQTAADAYYDFLIARHLEAAGDAKGAQAALEKAVAADPRSAEVRAELASFFLRRDAAEDAERVAKEALQLDEANSEAHRVLGMLYAARSEDTGRGQAAQAAAAELVKQGIAHLERVTENPAGLTDLNLQYTLGRLYTRAGQADKAIQALTRVVNENPLSVQARLALAQAYVAARDMNNAIEALQEIVDDEPRVANMLGQFQEQAGRLKDAADSYTKALSVAPNSRELKVRRIAALLGAKDFARAAEFAGQAQTQHPDDLRFPQLRAHALQQLGDNVRAIGVLEPVARANPNDATTQLALADLYSTVGRKNDAERTVRQLVAIEPGNADALNYLGYLLADSGRQLDEAIRLVRRALDIEPNNPNYLDSLGWAYYRRGDYEEAEKSLTPAAQQMPRNATVQEHYGDVLAKRGRWQDAIAAWTRALQGDEGDINKAAVEKKIADARGKVR
ncbi:MAG TPA: tetratricopeptide repeat protein [Vicinamibacterales bacterium]|jgi:Flp pilus assembly protein TadD|nr:tetratricopeptide repeat protein [Vicinamibacterales bacterium]